MKYLYGKRILDKKNKSSEDTMNIDSIQKFRKV